MRFLSTFIIFLFFLAPIPTSLADEVLYGFGYSKSRGTRLLKDVEEICFQTRVTVTAVDAKGSAIASEENSATLQKSIDAAIQPILERYGVPTSRCAQQDYRAKDKATLEVTATITPQNNDRELFEIRVHTDFAEVVQSSRDNFFVRVNVLMANHATMSRKKNELHKFAIDQSTKQVNWTADIFTKERLP